MRLSMVVNNVATLTIVNIVFALLAVLFASLAINASSARHASACRAASASFAASQSRTS